MLIDHFKLHLTEEKEEAIREWQLLKSLMYQRYGREIPTLKWRAVHAAFKNHGVSNILSLADLVLSLPPTSVFNERSFSHMKLIKSDKRSRMSSQTLSEIMTIKTESPNIQEFNPADAISLWMATPSGSLILTVKPNDRKEIW
ncbi:uncharacterized protein LOC134276793 [Saccostrea cucullata]|uniref:uncharacterized protein LOC134276793 n=1 Tax=Saccostrea cuccullata TaxID=36930 RepID=UPI002ED2E60F